MSFFVLADHFDDFHFGLDAQIVEGLLEILLHLDRVVLELGDGEEAHLAVAPRAVLTQQERQQHQQPAVVHDPPDVDKARDLRRNDKRGLCFAENLVIAS